MEETITAAASGMAGLIRELAGAAHETRRAALAALYSQLRAQGVPEPVAANLTHQIGRGIDRDFPAQPAGEALGGGLGAAGELDTTKEGPSHVK